RLYRQQTHARPEASLPAAPHPLRVIVNFNQSTAADPVYYWESASIMLSHQLFSGLVSLSLDLDILPDVAERWDVLDGGRRYLFSIRPGVRWSDGTAVTAHDFEYAWKRALTPATHAPMASYLYDIKGAKAYYEGGATDPAQLGVRALDDSKLLVELE